MTGSKAYGLLMLLSLMTLGYLAIEGLAHLTLKEADLLKPVMQQFPLQRSDLRRRWVSVVHDTSFPQRPPAVELTLMGLSTLRDGVDVELLHKARAHRVLSLSGSGGTLKGLNYLVAPILKDPQYSSTFGVIFLHPMWFAGWHPAPPPSPPPASASPLSHLSYALDSGLSSLLWIVNHRVVFSQGLHSVMDDMRQYYLNTVVQLPAHLQVTPHPHPWYKRPVRRHTPQASPSTLKRQWSAWISMGKGIDSNYLLHQEEQFSALKEMIDQAQDRVQQWVIVRMAEHSKLRSLAPPFLTKKLTSEALSQRLKTSISVWDASEVIPDSEFFDYAHMNAQGRARFTEAFKAYMLTQFDESY